MRLLQVSAIAFMLLVSVSATLARAEAPTAVDIAERRVTASKVVKPISIDLNEARLEDVIQFIRDFAGIEIDAFWLEDGETTGLNKDQLITISVKDVTVITLIERVMAKAQTDFSPATWQFAPAGGAIEVGPRARLNKQAFLKMYDVQDMIFQIPDFANAPELDLDQVLNQGGQGGGGGGGSVFGETGDNNVEFPSEEELARRIMDLITEYVEPEQWQDNGGEGGTIRYYNGFLLVRAPDYMHRQLSGYPFNLGRPVKTVTPPTAPVTNPTP